MRIVCLGGGPAGLYFSILMKKANPASDITVIERNQPDSTFGWGIVFSDKTMDGFREDDPQVVAEIEREQEIGAQDIAAALTWLAQRDRPFQFEDTIPTELEKLSARPEREP